MTAPQAPSITIGELEANYQLYCKALKMLIAEQRTLNKIKKTVCWGKLETPPSLPPQAVQIAGLSLRPTGESRVQAS